MLDVWESFEYASVGRPSYFTNQVRFGNQVYVVKSVSHITSKLKYKIKGR